MKEIRLLICDDHQLIIDGIRLMITDTANILVVGQANDGLEAVAFLKDQQADVILMDINMPNLDGIAACKKIIASDANAKIIFLSMINQLGLMQLLKDSGAKGYLLKNAAYEEIETAIVTVFKGSEYFDSSILETSDKNRLKRSVRYMPKLTSREKEVLKYILNEFTSSEIARKLFISSGTVDTHRRNMISKTGVKNTAGLVRMALEYKLLDK